MSNKEIIKKIEEAKNKFYPNYKGALVLWGMQNNYVDPSIKDEDENYGEYIWSDDSKEDDWDGAIMNDYCCSFKSIDHVLYSNIDDKIYVIVSYPVAIINSCRSDDHVYNGQKTVIIDKDILENLQDKDTFDKYFLFHGELGGEVLY